MKNPTGKNDIFKMHSTFLRNNGLDWIGLVGSQEEINKVCKFLNEVTGEMKKRLTTFMIHLSIYQVIHHVKL